MPSTLGSLLFGRPSFPSLAPETLPSGLGGLGDDRPTLPTPPPSGAMAPPSTSRPSSPPSSSSMPSSSVAGASAAAPAPTARSWCVALASLVRQLGPEGAVDGESLPDQAARHATFTIVSKLVEMLSTYAELVAQGHRPALVVRVRQRDARAVSIDLAIGP